MKTTSENKKSYLKKMLETRSTMAVCILLKYVVYYYLIEWSKFSCVYVIISTLITYGLYYSISKSKIKHKRLLFGIMYIGFSIFMFADVMYFNYYNQTVSIKQFWQIGNVAKVPESFVATLIPLSIFIISDIPLVLHQFGNSVKEYVDKKTQVKNKKKTGRIVVAIMLVIIIASNPMESASIAKFTGEEFFVNHTNDIIENTVGKMSEDDLSEEEVLKLISENKSQTSFSGNYSGIAAGRNVIMVQIEAMQNCMIGKDYNGITLTPTMNALIQNDTLYFDHFYSNVGKGNTADAEFTVFNSLYPSSERECYTLYEKNNFRGLPWLLKNSGYSTMAFHGYEGSFWNRQNAYPYQGIDNYYSMEKLNQDDIIGLGISDKSVFSQAVNIMKQSKGPFFSFVVTLTNHHPYVMDESMWEIPILDEDKDSKFASYLQTVHYTDEAIGQFINELKENGLYDNSIIIFYGDHHGLNKDMDDNDIYMSRFLGKKYDYDEMSKVPLIIHIPGSGAHETISKIGGQIDVLPTLANLMNIQLDERYVLGQDILNEEKGFVAFTAYMPEGSFITDGAMYELSRQKIYDTGRAWNPDTGESLLVEDYKAYYDKALNLKKASIQLLDHNYIPALK